MPKCFLALFLMAIGARGQAAQGRDPGVEMPQVIQKSNPEYTDTAFAARIFGVVQLTLVVQPDGTASDLQVTHVLGYGLDEKALEAVRRWRFKPATKDGQPVPFRATVEVSFRPPFWRIEDLSSKTTSCPKPMVIKEQYPSAGLAQRLEFEFFFDVDAQGFPMNIRTSRSSDPAWERVVLDAFRLWQLSPCIQNQTPMPYSARVLITNDY